jgi:hypothetical protein
MKLTHRRILNVISHVGLVAIIGVFSILIAQTRSLPQRPDVLMPFLEFRCPTYVVPSSRSMSLEADVVGVKEIYGEGKARRVAYSWEVSRGKIMAGQGTPKITFDPSELLTSGVNSIDVRLRLVGGPPELENERTCTLKMSPTCTPPHLFDQYGGVSATDEQMHLDRLVEYLNETPGSIAYVVAYAGRRSCVREAEWRANRAQKYLVEGKKIKADRIVAVDGGYRDELTIDLFIASDCCGPLPTPSLARSSAQVKGFCENKYKETVSQ